MSEREILKGYVAFASRERRISLEQVIDNSLSDEDVNSGIKFIIELNKCGVDHHITHLGYSESGDFSIKAEAGVSIKKQ